MPPTAPPIILYRVVHRRIGETLYYAGSGQWSKSKRLAKVYRTKVWAERLAARLPCEAGERIEVEVV